MELLVVGSGTASPQADHAGSCYRLSVGPSCVLLDCGPGALHNMVRLGVDWTSITHLCLSHFHTDHTGDVAALFFAWKYGQEQPRTAPLTVFGPKGTKRFLRKLAEAFGDYIKDPGFDVDIVELKKGVRIPLNDVAHISGHETPHTDTSIAFRIDGANKAVGYTGDTGPSVDVGSFLQSLDVLITECSVPDGHAMDGHLTPTRVAALARVALPRKTVLTHLYPRVDRESVIDDVRNAGWEGETVLATDGLRIVI